MSTQDLEAARQELAATIEAAKKRFEQSTGTTLTELTVGIISHLYQGQVDGSMITSVEVTAVYPATGSRQVTWTTVKR